MNHVQITTEHDGPYKSGDTIRGSVAIHLKKARKINGLNLCLRLRTHGRGDRFSKDLADVALAPKTLLNAGVTRYEFEIRVPYGPESYNGGYLNIEWQLVADLDLPWAIDKKNEFPVRVNNASLSLKERVEEIHFARPTLRSGSSSIVGIRLWVVLIMFALLLGAFLLKSYKGLASLENLLFGWVLLAMAVAGMIFVLFRVMARMRVADIQLDFPLREFSRGTPQLMELSFRGKKQTRVTCLTVELIGYELVTYSAGTDSFTEEHVFFSDTLLEEAFELAAGQRVKRGFAANIPTTMPASFEVSDNEIVWEARVHFDIHRWPDRKINRTLLVI